MAFIPYTHDSSSSFNDTKTVSWDWINGEGDACVDEVDLSICAPASYTGYFETSFIACSHSEGKSWESLFIPTDKNGLTGVSITWWNRKRGLAGQINVKQCAQAEFYDTIASKAVYKGYEVVSYVGRQHGLNRRHSFTADLYNRARSASPALAWGTPNSIPTSALKIGELMANSMLELTPIRAFLRKMAVLGHDGQMLALISSLCAKHSASKQQIGEIVQRFENDFKELDVNVAPTPSAKARKEKAVPEPKAKEDRYSGWGVFG